MHYPNIATAHSESYYSYDKQLDLSSGGIVYPFTGIRGDSKDLWSRIMRNNNMPRQSPVQLVKAVSVSEQKKHMKDADIVILATGYQSVQVPIIDCFGNRLTLVANSHMPLASNRTTRA